MVDNHNLNDGSMKMPGVKIPCLKTMVVLVCLFGLVGFFAVNASAANKIGGWKVKTEASMGFSYDTNVFKLTSQQSDRFDKDKSVVPNPVGNPDQKRAVADQTSGRFNKMDSIDDFIFTPRVKATFSRSGIMGRKLSITPSIEYNKYVQVQEKSYFDFGLGIKQKVGKHSHVGLNFGYAPNIFRKNFLSDAVDTKNPPGTINKISSNEKIFSPAHHDDTTAVLSYGRRLWKNHRKQGRGLFPDALSAKVLVGYENRNFDDPFTNRTEDNFLAGLDLGLALHKHTNLTLSYLFKGISTNVDTEVLIRNETNFGVDLNGDGDAMDLRIRTEQNVDRSRDQHTVGIKVSTRLRKGWYAHAKYEARFTSFNSQQPFDVSRLNRNDTRQKAALGLKGEIARRWFLALGWVNEHNHANRSGITVIDKAEVKSYDINVYSAVISRTF